MGANLPGYAAIPPEVVTSAYEPVQPAVASTPNLLMPGYVLIAPDVRKGTAANRGIWARLCLHPTSHGSLEVAPPTRFIYKPAIKWASTASAVY